MRKKQRVPARGAYLALAAGVFLLDQLSKAAITAVLALGDSRAVVPGLFNLTHVRNRGAAFGLFAGVESRLLLAFLIGFSVVALVLVAMLLWRGVASRAGGVGLGLILGGALGNLLDRVRQGSVVDFLDVHVAAYHWPAFNLADSAIVVGAAAVIFGVLVHRHQLAEGV